MQHGESRSGSASGTLAGAVAAVLTGCVDVPSALAPRFAGSFGLPHHGVVTGAVPMPKKGAGYVLFRDVASAVEAIVERAVHG